MNNPMLPRIEKIFALLVCTCTSSRHVVFILLTCIPFLLNAQLPVKNFDENLFEKYSAGSAAKANSYFVVQYDENNCRQLPFTIARNIAPGIAVIQTETDPLVFKHPCIKIAAPANNQWKLSAALEKDITLNGHTKKGTQLYTIRATDISFLLEALRQQHITFGLVYLSPEAGAAVIQCDPGVFVSSVLPHPAVLFADVYAQPSTDLMVSGYYRHHNHINETEHLFPAADGKGITIGIKENMMDETDIDLQYRIRLSVIAAKQKEFHANVIATLAGGAGNSFYTSKGVAYRCSFFPSSFNNIFPDSSLLLQQNQVTVQNHAYGTAIQSYYGAEALGYDAQTYQYPNLLHTFSSGNKGLEAATTGTYAQLPGFANITGNFKMAKNVITVAAVDTGGNLAPFSSAGPLFDGRLAPQLTALGPNGTSEAAAFVSGTAAILQQVYKEQNNMQQAPASLIKALLFTTADDIGNKGIDYKTGFGLLNIYGAVNCLQNNQYAGHQLAANEVWTTDLEIPASAANLKLTLTWTDTAATANTHKALVNDLDLELVHVQSGTVYLPWRLSLFPHKDSLNRLPARQRDSINTAEQVSIDLPGAGTYRVRVSARHLVTAMQTFHVAWNWDTLNNFRFTNPLHAADVDRKEQPNLPIKWKAVVADTNTTGTLSIRYDNNNWQVLAIGIRINRQQHNWAIPDVAATAQLRMETSFGIFYSPKFMIAPLTKINVDYRCTDSLRISWNKTVSATGYRLYALGDTAYIKPILTTLDTFAVLQRKLFPAHVYATEPLFTGGITGARSIAIDVRKQGVDCFFKTLLAESRGDSVALQLQLSFTGGITRIEMEKLTANGAIVGIISTIIPVSGQLNYQVWDAAPVNGTSYYRARIYVNGSTAYTDVVTVLHNGNNNLLLYPNPVVSGQPVSFRIKERYGDVTLQLADMMGRIIMQGPVSLADDIQTATLTRGLYFVTISDRDGKPVATQKLIIQ